MIGNNKLGDMGAIAIAKALEVNSTLNVLHLCTLHAESVANDQIGDSGASAIAKALEKNRGLIKLYLGNSCGDLSQ